MEFKKLFSVITRNMSELSELKEQINKLTQIVVGHISATEEYRTSRDKLVNAHSDALWDKNGNPGALTKLDRVERIADEHEEVLKDSKESPGLVTRVDRLIQKDHQRTWIMKIVVSAVTALGAERIWELIKSIKQ